MQCLTIHYTRTKLLGPRCHSAAYVGVEAVEKPKGHLPIVFYFNETGFFYVMYLKNYAGAQKMDKYRSTSSTVNFSEVFLHLR